MTRRTERVAETLRAELARLLREEVTDPRIEMVSLTHVDLAPDFGSARIGWSRVDADAEELPETIERIAAGLESAAPFLRRRLARELPLKRVPDLRFRYDPSLVLGTRTLGTLRELAVPPREDEAPSDESE